MIFNVSHSRVKHRSLTCDVQVCVAGGLAQSVGDHGLVDAAVSVTGAPNEQVVDIPV